MSTQMARWVLTQAGFIAKVKDIRVPEEEGPTQILLELASGPDGRSLEVRAVASAIVQRLTPAAPPTEAKPQGAERA
ncbi:MAG: hypothetical protein HYS09_03440 [Chloroflexi bacterium]|nr:hypothetical protein [Chloroflexota bacterium]